MKSKYWIIIIFVLILFYSQAPKKQAGLTYYVSSTGSDTNDGLSQSTPFKSVTKVNSLTLSPGDSVLFKRGDTWRLTQDGLTLQTKSGSSVGYTTFGAYGSGPQPLFLGSYTANKTSNWISIATNKWLYSPQEIGLGLLINPGFEASTTAWSFYSTTNATGKRVTNTFDTGIASYEVHVNTKPSSASDIQFYATGIPISAGKIYKLQFKAKSTNNGYISDVPLMMAVSPYSLYYSTSTSRYVATTNTWNLYTIYYKSTTTSTNARITFALGNYVSNTSIYFDSFSFVEVESMPPVEDIGNLIFNNDQSIGVKKRKGYQVSSQGDFIYNLSTSQLILYSTTNPATFYSNIEMASRNGMVNVGGKSYLKVENLHLKYGGSHGISGGSLSNLILQYNTLDFIGGSNQNTNPSVTQEVRFGNAIQIGQSGSNVKISYNNISECYDAAITPQSWDSTLSLTNFDISYNIIKRCEYGYEFFTQMAGASTTNISVHHNTFIEMGYQKQANQRWDGGYGMTMRLAKCTLINNLAFRDNIFYNPKGTNIYMTYDAGWINSPPQLDYNYYYKANIGIDLLQWTATKYASLTAFQAGKGAGKELHGYQSSTGTELDINTATPKTGSVLCTMSSTGSYIGAIPCDTQMGSSSYNTFVDYKNQYILGTITLQQFIDYSNIWVAG